METPTYSTIQHLVQTQDVQGKSISVTFQCPTTGIASTGTGELRRLSSFQSRASRMTKEKLWTSLRRTATRAIATTLGRSAPAQIARELANMGLSEAQKGSVFSQEEIRAGVVRAFETVLHKFKLDDSGRWTGDATTQSSKASLTDTTLLMESSHLLHRTHVA